MSLVLISSARFAEHQTPTGHPERAERARVMEMVASRWAARGGRIIEPRPVTVEQLARVHTREHIERIDSLAGRAVALDPDTYTSSETREIALLAAGAAVQAVEIVMGGDPSDPQEAQRRHGLRAALAMVRPPGHHAESGTAMGFCLYNNVAVAAAHARAAGAARVAIVDYDVHHGNGTQHMFESDPNVLYISLHQFPFYPGTGAMNEIGRAGAEGLTLNLPMEVGAVNEDYQLAFSSVVVPVLEQFAPNILLVSAGFDAHEHDPLAGMRLTTGAFAAMTMALRRVSDACCEGRMVLVTEGGYDLRALEDSLEAVVESLSGPATDVPWPASGIEPHRGRVCVDQVARVFAPFWKLV